MSFKAASSNTNKPSSRQLTLPSPWVSLAHFDINISVSLAHVNSDISFSLAHVDRYISASIAHIDIAEERLSTLTTTEFQFGTKFLGSWNSSCSLKNEDLDILGRYLPN